MRQIIIERAVLIAGEHHEPGPAALAPEIADYLVRQGCARKADAADKEAAQAAADAKAKPTKTKADKA